MEMPFRGANLRVHQNARLTTCKNNEFVEILSLETLNLRNVRHEPSILRTSWPTSDRLGVEVSRLADLLNKTK